MQLGQILVRKGLVTKEQLDAARRESDGAHGRLPEALVRLGFVAEEALCRAISEHLNLPYVELEETGVELAALDKVPVKIIFEKKLLPISNGETLTVAISDPFDVNTLDELRLLLHRSVRPVVARPSEIDKMIRKFYGVGGAEVDRMMAVQAGEEAGASAAVSEHDVEMAEDASLIKFVNQLILEAVRERSSDIHVEPFEDELRIRYRIDGVLHRVSVPPHVKKFQSAIVSRLKIMSNLNIAEKRLPQDGRIKIKADGREIDIRVSVIPGIHGEGIVLRILDQEQIRFSLEDLGMPKDVLGVFADMMAEPNGTILVTGPTGSGKTTTLYAALQKINSEEDKIVTIEDPVEYRLKGIKQIQVNPKIGLTFAGGLRAILRHDPDIVMVGEVRDYDTAEIMVQAALTGHLVFSTLHTNDAPTAVTRLVDMGVEPYLVASTVEGCMAQRLVRRVCSQCAREEEVGEERIRRFLPADIKKVMRGAGCEYCRKTGYRGRTGLYEIMRMDDAIRDLVVAKESSTRIKKACVERGMKTLRDRGWEEVRKGATTPEEVLRITKEDYF
jgi:type II secretion system protein E